MLDADELVVVSQIPFSESCSTHSQLRVFCKSTHEESKIIVIKGNVGVQVADNVVPQFDQFLVSGVNGESLSGKMPFATVGQSDQFNPRVFDRITLDDFVSSVR